MRFASYLFLIIIIIFPACSESEYEIETREELSSIIRRVDNAHKSIYQSRDQVGSQSIMSSKDFYEEFSKKFDSIGDDLAAAPTAEKFDSVRVYLEDIISLSNGYVFNKEKLFTNVFELSNTYSSYYSNAEDMLESVSNYREADYSRDYYLDRIIDEYADMREDSATYYNAEDSIKGLMDDYNTTERDLMASTMKLNNTLIEMNFRDTLQFHNNYLFTDSVITDVWNNTSGKDLRPSEDFSTGIKILR